MNVNVDKTAAWTLLVTGIGVIATVLAVIVAIVYASIHLVRETADQDDITKLETKIGVLDTNIETKIGALDTKMDKGFAEVNNKFAEVSNSFNRIEKILVNDKLHAKQEMIDHLSTAHAVAPSE
jgi:hypothetical protein